MLLQILQETIHLYIKMLFYFGYKLKNLFIIINSLVVVCQLQSIIEYLTLSDIQIYLDINVTI